MVGDLVLIETDGAGNMAGRIFGIRIAFLHRQIEGGVQHTQIRFAEFGLQPVGRDDETALALSHHGLPCQASSPGAPKRMRKRRFSLPFFSILAM